MVILTKMVMCFTDVNENVTYEYFTFVKTIFISHAKKANEPKGVQKNLKAAANYISNGC